MKIHKEGAPIILCAAALAIVLAVLSFWLLPTAAAWIVSVTAWIGVLFITSFFRSPSRPLLQDDGAVYSPADGTIVALEEVEEKEYFKDNRIVVSVFMSIWNVHINWFPVSGTVDYFRHHHGCSWWRGTRNRRKTTNGRRRSWTWEDKKSCSARSPVWWPDGSSLTPA